MPRLVLQTAKAADTAIRIWLLCGIVAVGGSAQGGPTRERHANPATGPASGDAVWRGTLVHYVLKDGLPIYGGDIVLDHIASAPRPAAAGDTSPRAAEPKPQTAGTVYPGYLWPSVNGVYQIPYSITNGNADLNSPAPGGASPSGAGTLTVVPAPTSFPAAGQFFIANESVVLTANASPGYNLFNWNGSYFCEYLCLGGSSPNPMNLFYWTTLNPAPAFTTSHVTTITTDPPGLQVLVDGEPYYTPHPFTPDPRVGGSAWAPGTTHTVSAVSPQNPWSPNTTYAWSSWSDGQGQTHQITLPAGNRVFTANFATQAGLVLGTNSGTGACAGSVTALPAGPVAPGASVAFTAAPSQGFVFTQWEGALSGSANPASATVSGEEFVQADFNTVSAPLTITSLSPSVVSAGSGPFNLTINGTGFTTHAAGEWVYIWYNGGEPLYLPATYITSTELQVTVPAANVASPGAIQIIVENFSVAGCWVVARSQLVISTLEAPALPLTISGAVTESGAGLGGVAVTLSGSQTGTATTDASGNYSFAVQAGGGYMVTPSLPGYTFNLPSRSFNNLIDSQANVSFAANPPPALYVSSTHICGFASGQVAATYTLIVGNADSAGPTSGTVTVSEKAPSGLSLVSMSGIGWSCVSNTCTRTDPLAPGMIYPVITVTVNVARNAVTPAVNQVSVSGGASAPATAVDSTNIAPPGCDINRDGNTTIADIQALIDEARGTAPAVDDLNTDGTVNVVDVQIAILAVLGMGCTGV